MKDRAWLWGLCTLLTAGCSQNYSDQKSEAAMAQNGLTPIPKTVAEQTTLPADHPPIQRQAASPAAQSQSQSQSGERQDLGGISVVMPPGWEQMPPANQMRLAEYRLTGGPSGTADAVLTVFYFGRGQGGAVDANIDRWYGQFTQEDGGDTKARARRWKKDVHGMAVHLVDIRGQFSGGMGANAIPQARMLGAIAEAKAGAFFFKVVGTKQTIDHWEASFEAYVESFRDA
jgi:hypothetical protein